MNVTLKIVLREEVQTNLSRPVLHLLSKSLSSLNNDEAMQLGTYTVDALANRQMVFEEEVK